LKLFKTESPKGQCWCDHCSAFVDRRAVVLLWRSNTIEEDYRICLDCARKAVAMLEAAGGAACEAALGKTT
jgi:hypothetical protein